MSKNAKLCVVVPVLLGFFALACFRAEAEKTGPQGNPNASPKHASSASQPTGGALELALLQARVAGMEAELHAAQPAPVEMAAHSAEPEPERRAPEPGALQAHYDAVLASENRDARWAPVEENAVVALFATDSAKGSRLENAECRESMCRIRVRFDDRDARAHFLANIGLPPFDHGGFYRSDEATGAFTLYTARAGRTLPGLDSGPL